ncbi:F-box domain-containing protein [Blastomyces gilchristii SLH14081]|uniref:F-box domain-containing protein n=1 Tax=Blastomyces gilchristii (strain SLH14081) TaxID=559298 RepID=A0A179UUV8_BLAGS|nr:F-box domain-containing protein [Blastomyces gilchristii SLH14081]OAT10182.1 F-box domain-containing protein [Blastomyces gilchristii SLH14081]
MPLDTFATELLLQIFYSCNSIADVLNLSLTCRRLHGVFSSSQKLPILANAVDAEFGPLEDIIQLITQNASQPAHVSREAPISLSLIQQAVEVGRVAKKWEEIYPIKKWKVDFENRRVLNAQERLVLRRAAYRLWLYSRAFHCQLFPRTSRTLPSIVHERAELLHNWSTSELAEIEDFRLVMRELTNTSPNFTPDLYHEPGTEGWGDQIHHYYVVEDMMKLDPSQVLWLRENAPLKGQVESYVRSMGDWFDNNGETFGQTLEWVMNERGGDYMELHFSIVDGEVGIATAKS